MAHKRRIPKLCHHKGSGQSYVTDPATHLPVYLGKWGSDEAAAAYDRWVRAFLARDPADIPRPAAGLSVAQLVIYHDRHAQQYYRKHGEPTSQLALIRQALRFVKDAYADLPAANFGPVHLRRVQAAMVAHGLARKTVNRFCSLIRGAWAWGVSQGAVPADVLVALRTVPGLRRGRTAAPEPGPVQPVPWSLVEQTLPHLRPMIRSLVLLQYCGAMRPQDVVCLRPCDVDRSTEPWLYTPWSWKTEHHGGRRKIWLGPRAREVLAGYLASTPEEGWCFPGRSRAKHYQPTSYREAVADACKRGRLPHWHPNQLRHAMLTEVRRAHGIEAAQHVGGHAHVEMTEIYAERNEEVARRVVEGLG